MSFSTHAGLPRTRSFHRPRPMRLWWGAVVVALAANLGIVFALGQVSRLGHPASVPPIALRRLRQIAPEPPPPPPEQLRDTREPVVEVAAPVALPSLDLPAVAAGTLSLPAVGSYDAALNLPTSIPAFTAMALVSGPTGVPAAALVVGPPAFDTPAQREGVLDLDRFFPRTARLRGITGTTRIRSHIDSAGRVTAVEVLESQPSGVFEQAAERLGKAQRFRPAQKSGAPVPAIQDTTITWTIR